MNHKLVQSIPKNKNIYKFQCLFYKDILAYILYCIWGRQNEGNIWGSNISPAVYSYLMSGRIDFYIFSKPYYFWHPLGIFILHGFVVYKGSKHLHFSSKFSSDVFCFRLYSIKVLDKKETTLWQSSILNGNWIGRKS